MIPICIAGSCVTENQEILDVFEMHPNPEKALNDGVNRLYLKDVERVIHSL